VKLPDEPLKVRIQSSSRFQEQEVFLFDLHRATPPVSARHRPDDLRTRGKLRIDG
jgi:hypothetical protein